MSFPARLVIRTVLLVSLPYLGGCGDGANLGNLRPQVDAGISQSVKSGATVTLDGSRSRDPDGSIESFLWRQEEGPGVELNGAESPKATFIAPPVSNKVRFVFRLTATDDAGASGSDKVVVTVRPATASAQSGMDSRPLNASCVAPQRPVATSAEIELQRAFSPLTFDKPLALLQAPGDDSRWYVVEQGGYVHTFTGGQQSATLFADISDRVQGVAYQGDERGLLGMAFPPDFATSRKVYLSYTRKPDSASVISRFSSDGISLDPGSEEVILTVAQPGSNHNGGNIAFGPDGYLYIGFGDGGGAGDQNNNAQNTANLLGAMLRIDVSRSANGKPYAIPADNPFASSSGCGSGAGCPEIWAWGLRNPWRWSFDRVTGKLWAADVGQDAWEEVNVVEKGGNYGWRCYEGNHAYNTDGCEAPERYVAPLAEHGHGDRTNYSITGGYVYRGAAIPALRGTYIYGDFVSSVVRGLSVEPGSRPQELLEASYKYAISSFGEGNDGELYLVDYKSGHLFRIVPKGGAVNGADSFPRRLSETGCFDADDPTRPAAGLIPYDVNALLWSDGAEKYRWFAIPDGSAIRIDEDGNNWVFPRGSVLVKEFRIGGKRVETRLLVRHDDGEWAGYSYEWNPQETDATLLDGAKSREIAGQRWDYPSPAQCMFCHTAAAGFALGPETVQLNGLFTYPGGATANQMKSYESVGMFTDPLPDTLPALVDYMDPDEPLEERARAYLYANCSSCHRPGATGLVDFRHDTPLAGMGICGKAPARGRMGLGRDALLLAPGEPSRSVILARMKSTGPGRMPPLGTALVDPAGVEIITSWILSLSGCPDPS